MSLPQNALLELVGRLLGRLRFPQLFLLMAALFVIDVLVPDLVPFVDEILLGLATLLLGSWTDRRKPRDGTQDKDPREPEPERGPVIDVTPDN